MWLNCAPFFTGVFLYHVLDKIVRKLHKLQYFYRKTTLVSSSTARKCKGKGDINSMTQAISLSKLPLEWYYLLMTALFLISTIILVPRRCWRNLFPFALIAGSFIEFCEIIIDDRLLGLYHYAGYGAFHVFNVPFGVIMAWNAAMLLFLYFLPDRRQHPTLWWMYLAASSLLTVSIELILNQLGIIIVFSSLWGALPRAIISFVWLTAASLLYRKYFPRESDS